MHNHIDRHCANMPWPPAISAKPPSMGRSWGTNRRRVAWLRVCLVLILGWCFPLIASAQNYFPVPPTGLWTLRATGLATPVTLEILDYQLGATTLRFRTPWSNEQWQVVPQNNQVLITGYGVGDVLAPVSGTVVFFDFGRSTGSSWTSLVGRMDVVAKGGSFKAGSKTYANVVRLKQTSGASSFIYTFAPQVGLVGFEVGRYKFFLDEASSRIKLPAHPLARATYTPPPKMLVGTTLNTFANEALTTENLVNRYNQLLAAGMNYISAAGLWTDLEPSPGVYSFDSVDFMVYESTTLGLEGSYTLRAIDTLVRRLPDDLQQRRWSDPVVEQRALSLVDALVTRFAGRVKWFMFGNEIDSYFASRPDEIQEFAALLAKIRVRAKQLAPNMAVSTTVGFANAGATVTALAPIDASCDVLTLTYYPVRHTDFIVEDSTVPARDVARMRLLARGRGVLLQEIGYPSGSLNASSPVNQAAFYSNVFAAMRANRDLIDAGNFFVYADLSDEFTSALASYYGSGQDPAFKSFLQTLGMFDGAGGAKQSWSVFATEIAR